MKDNDLWDTEPNSFDCEHLAIRRHPIYKHLCGYVGVPEGHPLYNKGIHANIPVPPEAFEQEVEVSKVNLITLVFGTKDPEEGMLPLDLVLKVHGGITWADKDVPTDDRKEDGLWWFGFDCSHAGDLSPGLMMHQKDVYRTFEFVQAECAALARQLAQWRLLCLDHQT